MARHIAYRISATGALECLTPVHVGGAFGDADADLQLAMNGRGDHYIPGTSLCGALRAWVTARVGADQAAELFGFQDRRDGSSAANGQASRIIVSDAPLPDARPEIREGVGIDRRFGSAAAGILYDRAVLPRGTRIPFEVVLEVPEGDGSDRTAEAVLADALGALQEGWIPIGGGTTRGYGRVRLADLAITKEELGTRAGMLEALTSGGREISLEDLRSAHAGVTFNPMPRIRFVVQLVSDGALMVRSGADGLPVDALPLTTTHGDTTYFVLSGSSVKGALRSHAERIVRTIGGLKTAKDFLEQVEVPLVDWLFGSTGGSSGTEDDSDLLERPDEGEPVKGRGAVSVRDTHAKLTVAADAWREMLSAKDVTQFRLFADRAGAEAVQAAFHVSVDRWTAGAVDGRLFTETELLDLEWEPLEIEIDLTRLNPASDELVNQRAAIALLSLVLHELSTGRLPLGYAVNRGMGGVKVTNIRIEGNDLDAAGLAELGGLEAPGGFRDIPEPLRRTVLEDWQDFCDGLKEESGDEQPSHSQS